MPIWWTPRILITPAVLVAGSTIAGAPFQRCDRSCPPWASAPGCRRAAHYSRTPNARRQPPQRSPLQPTAREYATAYEIHRLEPLNGGITRRPGFVAWGWAW